jgi:hypothetical protein
VIGVKIPGFVDLRNSFAAIRLTVAISCSVMRKETWLASCGASLGGKL